MTAETTHDSRPSVEMLENEEQRAVEAMLRRFAAEIDRTLFDGEDPDGDLTRVPALLNQAREMGLVADPSISAPGYELGVWGRSCLTESPRRSLLALSILAEACAGFATAVHAQGLACLVFGERATSPPTSRLAAVFSAQYGVPLSARLRSAWSGLELTCAGTHKVLQLNGTGHFVLAAAAPDKLICFARRVASNDNAADWVCLAMDARVSGAELTELPRAHRSGLRAARQYHLRCSEVELADDAVVRRGEDARLSLAQILACDWLGQAAIALGVARRSLCDSRAYATQRYQGGQTIDRHASVQLLQGTATYDIALLGAILFKHADVALQAFDPNHLLRWAVQARLAVVEHAHRAVTNSLQVLGGSGYMADYRLEKQLRDVSTLKILHGAPDQLRLFLNELATQR